MTLRHCLPSLLLDRDKHCLSHLPQCYCWPKTFQSVQRSENRAGENDPSWAKNDNELFPTKSGSNIWRTGAIGGSNYRLPITLLVTSRLQNRPSCENSIVSWEQWIIRPPADASLRKKHVKRLSLNSAVWFHWNEGGITEWQLVYQLSTTCEWRGYYTAHCC